MPYPTNVPQHISSRHASSAPPTAVFVGTDGSEYYRDERDYSTRYYTFIVEHRNLTEAQKNQIVNDYFAINGGMTSFTFQGDYGDGSTYQVKYVHEPNVVSTNGFDYAVRSTLRGYKVGYGP